MSRMMPSDQGTDHLNAVELTALRDGLPLPADRSRHLEECAGCRIRLEGLADLGRSLSGLLGEPLPPGLETRIIARLREEERAALPAWLAFWGRPAGIATAALLFALALFGAPRWLEGTYGLTSDWAWAAGLPASENAAAASTTESMELALVGDADGGAENGAH